MGPNQYRAAVNDVGVTFTPADAGLSGTFSAIAIDPAERTGCCTMLDGTLSGLRTAGRTGARSIPEG